MAAITKENMPVCIEAKVNIGDGHAATNKVVIALTNMAGEAKVVRVTVKVKCGNTQEALLGASTAMVTATCTHRDVTQITAKDDQIGWQTSDYGIEIDQNKFLKITLANFDSYTPPGPAEVEVVVQPKEGDDWGGGFSEKHPVKKTEVESEAAKIHYFTVSPDYLLHAGRKDAVTVAFHATKFKEITLYRNNQIVRELAPDSDGAITANSVNVISMSFKDGPSITTVYRLEATKSPKTPSEEGPTKILQRTVHVISPGWNQIALPQGYPTRLFVATDFSGSGKERLYGIFVNGTGAAKLYSSATGIDDWREEKGNQSFPQHMKTSPGVCYGNKLWLIGGSSVNDDQISKEVWSYEEVPNKKGEMNWKRWKDSDMPAHMGHACVVVPGKGVWVLGGYDKKVAYNDVWQLMWNKESKIEDKTVWSRIPDKETDEPKPRWPKHLGLAAASGRFNPSLHDNEVWIYGGSDTLVVEEPSTELWSTKDGMKWTLEPGINPSPGAPIAAALLNYRVTDPEKLGSASYPRVFLAGTFLEPAAPAPGSKAKRNLHSSFLFEWHGRNRKWERRSVGDGWQQFEGDPFYMQAVCFGGFIYVWSVHAMLESKDALPSQKAPPKLNVLIP